MLVGTVEEVGEKSPLGLAVGDRVTTLVSLTLTPLVIEDGLARWDGLSEQVPADGYAILFGRSIAARIPDDLPAALSLSVMDVCGAPGTTARVVGQYVSTGSTAEGRPSPSSGAPASGSLSLVAPRRPALPGRSGWCRTRRRPTSSRPSAWRTRSPSPMPATRSRSPVPWSGQAARRRDRGASTYQGAGAILATADRGTVIFFSMATSFGAAALGAEGLAADVTMLVGNGYVPGAFGLRHVADPRPSGSAATLRTTPGE